MTCNFNRSIFLFILFFNLSSILYGQDFPLIYSNNFEKSQELSDFAFSDPEAWKMDHFENNHFLELFKQSNYKTKVRSPFNIALLKTPRVGSFILEARLKQTGRNYAHRDMVLVFGFKDATNFYYVHIASATDEYAHNIFIVNDEARKAISTKTNDGIDWGQDWNNIRLVRNVSSGMVYFYFNDMDTPIMETKDTHFNEGLIGFGSFDDTGRIDDVKIWGEITESKKGIFK